MGAIDAKAGSNAQAFSCPVRRCQPVCQHLLNQPVRGRASAIYHPVCQIFLTILQDKAKLAVLFFYLPDAAFYKAEPACGTQALCCIKILRGRTKSGQLPPMADMTHQSVLFCIFQLLPDAIDMDAQGFKTRLPDCLCPVARTKDCFINLKNWLAVVMLSGQITGNSVCQSVCFGGRMPCGKNLYLADMPLPGKAVNTIHCS